MIKETFMAQMIGKPNEQRKDNLTIMAVGFPNMGTWFERLRARRKELGLSQADLYRSVGVSNATVSDWESGKMKPRGDNLMKLCNALDTTADWLLYGKARKAEKLDQPHDDNAEAAPEEAGRPQSQPGNVVEGQMAIDTRADLERLVSQLLTSPDKRALLEALANSGTAFSDAQARALADLINSSSKITDG
jgi:transcriptional regulator with XRE-family HTH domain